MASTKKVLLKTGVDRLVNKIRGYFLDFLFAGSSISIDLPTYNSASDIAANEPFFQWSYFMVDGLIYRAKKDCTGPGVLNTENSYRATYGEYLYKYFRIEESNSNKVNKSGDTIEGDLTINGTLNVVDTNDGMSHIYLGNNKESAATDKSAGYCRIYDNSPYFGQIQTRSANDHNESKLTGNRFLYIPDRSGDIVLDQDIVTYYAGTAPGSTHINIPKNGATWEKVTDVIVVVTFPDISNLTFTFTIPNAYDHAWNSNKFIDGFYYSDKYYASVCVRANRTYDGNSGMKLEFWIDHSWTRINYNGTIYDNNNKPNSATYVYYRKRIR